MKLQNQISSLDLSEDWAIRSDYWLAETANAIPRRRLRQRNQTPLILNGHGISMRIESDALVIRDGFTHYPQTQTQHRYFLGDLNLPTRILLLDGSGTLSFDVLSWLAEQGIALARVKWTGEVATVASGTGYAAEREKIAWQNETRTDNTKRLAFAADIIRQKITASIATLENHIPASELRDAAVCKARAGIGRLAVEAFDDVNAVFAIEGECAAAYFAAWTSISMNWTGTARRPVPDGWRVYGGRSSLATGVKPENRNASHPINAMLNYAYTVKLAKMQIDAIAEGYDPSFGILHNGRRGKPALILDLIEPERPIIDAAIQKFIKERKFSASDFIIGSNGVCRISPQLARMIASLIA